MTKQDFILKWCLQPTEEQTEECIVDLELLLEDCLRQSLDQRIKKTDDTIEEFIEEYNHAREDGDVEGIQSARDNLSQILWHFAKVETQLRALSEKAVDDRKICISRKKVELKNEDIKRSMSLIEDMAMVYCEEIFTEQHNSRENYLNAKRIIERGDQILNAIASRTKITLKTE